MVKKYEPRFIVALWLASCCLRRWANRDVYSKFRFQWIGLSIVLYCYVWSAEKLYAWTLARSKSVKEVLTYLSLSQDFFLSYFFFPISRKKRYINRFLCLLALTARWGVALQSEKSDSRFISKCPQQLNKLRIWYRVLVKQPGLRINKTGTAASRKQE